MPEAVTLELVAERLDSNGKQNAERFDRLERMISVGQVSVDKRLGAEAAKRARLEERLRLLELAMATIKGKIALLAAGAAGSVSMASHFLLK